MPPIGSKTIALRIPVNWLYGIVVLVIALILAFIFVPNPTTWRPVLVFGAAVIAGAAGLTTAINNVDQRGAAATKAAQQAQEGRVAAALDFFYRWNDPTFFYCKRSGREIREAFKTRSVDEQLVHLKEDSTRLANLFDLLNTFEALHIAIDKAVIDEDTARRFFRSIVIEYWHQTNDVIQKM